MKVFISLLTIVSMSLLISCSNSDSTVSRGPQMEGATFDNYEMAIATAPTSSRSTDMKNRSSISEDSRIQIWGNISLQVQNISKAMKQIEDLVNQYDARVTSSESGDSYNKYARISILVPKESFEELIQDINDVGSKVTSENISSADVTEEFVDIEARLSVMRETENRFITLFSETSSVEEVLTVEKELMRLRGDIDSLEGRMQYLNKTTNNSVLNVNLTEEVPITGNDWSIFDSLDNSVRDFVSFSRQIASWLINAIVFSPIIIGAGLLLFCGNKFRKRYINRRKK